MTGGAVRPKQRGRPHLRPDALLIVRTVDRERNPVEPLVGRLKKYRRLAVRHDKLAATDLAFLTLAAIRLRLEVRAWARGAISPSQAGHDECAPVVACRERRLGAIRARLQRIARARRRDRMASPLGAVARGRQGFLHFGRDPDVGAAAGGQREDQESSMHMATRCGAATARLAVCAAILDVRPAALSGRLRGSSQGHRGRPLPSTRTRGFWPELPVAGSAVVVGGPKTGGSHASTRRVAAYQRCRRCRRCRREHGPPHAQPSFLGRPHHTAH